MYGMDNNDLCAWDQFQALVRAAVEEIESREINGKAIVIRWGRWGARITTCPEGTLIQED